MRRHGITSDTYKRIIIDSGQVRFNYVDESNPGYKIGATRGGNSFVVEQEFHSAKVDGEKGEVKGGKRIVKINVSITANIIELVPWILNLALPGSTTEEHPVLNPTHKQIRRALNLLLADFGSSIALIGQVHGSTEPMICCISNPLASGNLEIAFLDNDESVLKIQFIAHFNPDDLDTEPWTTRNPKPEAAPDADFTWESWATGLATLLAPNIWAYANSEENPATLTPTNLSTGATSYNWTTSWGKSSTDETPTPTALVPTSFINGYQWIQLSINGGASIKKITAIPNEIG
jgi:hypothetical protein